ncbi:MAG: hypothetical protein E7561_02875 [Ruminococcaceae bacterium]|nr:hypothetical protein [Oscillospiraceae bacterium]
MLWLLRYIKGFLKIELSGENAERLINTASKNGILLWNLGYSYSRIVCSVSIKDFKEIFNLHKAKGVSVKIHKKIGLPFIIHRYRRRSGLLIGGVIFLVILEFLSSFIWTIEVEGNKYVSTKEILSACEKIGVYEGVPISRINTKNAADRLLLELPSLAWGSLNIEGSLITVNVTEVKNQPQEKSKNPTNIIASETGIIKKIDVTSGNVLVNVGDAVAKGDVLVSGIIESMNSTVFVHSRGVVTAEVEKTLSLSGKFEETVKHRTGKVKKRFKLGVFGVDLPLYFSKPKERAEVESSIERLEILKRKLPFFIKEDKYYLTEQRKISKTPSELKEKLYADMKKQLTKYKNTEVTVIDEVYEETESGAELKLIISLITDIAEQKEITVLTENEPDKPAN